ncbi:MAG: hypothetical protein MUF64_22630 [Polyangiaceae bacterium]|jgi:hypothetical protein|nr:hypothetical protein [Polyangiaceae bacterium]
MSRPWAAALLLLGGALPAPAAASEPPRAANETVQLGLRSLGWAIPFGRMSRAGVPVSDTISGAFPMMLDLGGKISPRLFLGAYLGFNVGYAGDAYSELCQRSVSCSANNVRLGLQAQLHLRPARRLNPWIGLGFGTEATTVTAETRINNITQTLGGTSSFQGIEYLHMTLGLDFRAEEIYGYGPYVTFTTGSYETTTARNTSGTNRTRAIPDPSLHHWLTIGIRLILFP